MLQKLDGVQDRQYAGYSFFVRHIVAYLIPDN